MWIYICIYICCFAITIRIVFILQHDTVQLIIFLFPYFALWYTFIILSTWYHLCIYIHIYITNRDRWGFNTSYYLSLNNVSWYNSCGLRWWIWDIPGRWRRVCWVIYEISMWDNVGLWVLTDGRWRSCWSTWMLVHNHLSSLIVYYPWAYPTIAVKYHIARHGFCLQYLCPTFCIYYFLVCA